MAKNLDSEDERLTKNNYSKKIIKLKYLHQKKAYI